jgi:hypothetical protein
MQFAFLKITSGKNLQIVNNVEVFLIFEDTFLKLRIAVFIYFFGRPLFFREFVSRLQKPVGAQGIIAEIRFFPGTGKKRLKRKARFLAVGLRSNFTAKNAPKFRQKIYS